MFAYEGFANTVKSHLMPLSLLFPPYPSPFMKTHVFILSSVCHPHLTYHSTFTQEFEAKSFVNRCCIKGPSNSSLKILNMPRPSLLNRDTPRRVKPLLALGW